MTLAAGTFHLGEPHFHYEVWLLVAALASAYAIAIRRVGPKWVEPGRPLVTRLQVTCWSLGLLAIWLAADYPVHDVAENSMYSVHMVQHLLFSMVAAVILYLIVLSSLHRFK